MLVLARKVDESIVIGDDIVVKVVSVEGSIVKLGIEAPKDVSIFRDELLQEVKETNKASISNVDKTELEQLHQLLNK